MSIQNRDELTGWFKSLEADYDLNARSFILELWKGAIAYELARVGNGEIQITSGTLSIIGGIQPSARRLYLVYFWRRCGLDANARPHFKQ